ncbi:MAG TPA: hypothetical protein VFC24_10220 [Casimicrobiaceae bacterium]|nr:hypothetical protein [Casimicrobiaceae bacterium]
MNVTPAFARRLDQLSPASDRVWIAGMAIGLGLTLVAAYVPLPAHGGTMCAYLGLLVRAAMYAVSGEALAQRGGSTLSALLRLGVVAGAFELIVDWWLVNGITNGRLDYLGARDVVLLASPIWMPLAWACVIVELGYPALRLFAILRQRMNDSSAAIIASIVVASGAGVTIGFYEYFAYRAGWWKYAPAHAMIGEFCALFIPVGEALMFLAILPIASRAFARDDQPVRSAVTGGVLFSVAIFVGYAMAYALLEWRRTP